MDWIGLETMRAMCALILCKPFGHGCGHHRHDAGKQKAEEVNGQKAGTLKDRVNDQEKANGGGDAKQGGDGSESVEKDFFHRIGLDWMAGDSRCAHRMRCVRINQEKKGKEFPALSFQASGVGRRASGVGRRASGVGRRASGVGRRASGVGRRASGVKLLKLSKIRSILII